VLQIRFLGDPTAKFTKALDLAFDGTAIFGGPRSKRYALEIEDGKVKALHVEPDNTGLNGISLLLFPSAKAPTPANLKSIISHLPLYPSLLQLPQIGTNFH
jgi:hypothetical protein